MSYYSWDTAPATVRRQVTGLVDELKRILSENLIGVYIHGSLAMGCFNPERSDLDLLVVTGQGMDLETKRTMVETLLSYSTAPNPIEISFVTEDALRNWSHPLPFDLHFSEDWRDRYNDDLAGNAWKQWNDHQNRDEDLAAHCTIIIHRGICLYGKPIAEVFPCIPAADYRDAITGDFTWAQAEGRLAANPVYFILNTCRILAYLQDGLILSKDEGGIWGLDNLPQEYQPLIAQALASIDGESSNPIIDQPQLDCFARFAAPLIQLNTANN